MSARPVWGGWTCTSGGGCRRPCGAGLTSLPFGGKIRLLEKALVHANKWAVNRWCGWQPFSFAIRPATRPKRHAAQLSAARKSAYSCGFSPFGLFGLLARYRVACRGFTLARHRAACQARHRAFSVLHKTRHRALCKLTLHRADGKCYNI